MVKSSANPDNHQAASVNSIKRAAVAGYFYPDNTGELRSMLSDMLRLAAPAVTSPPKALIVPHAGYVYSGPVAATGYASLIPARHTIKRVVLMGPAHRVYLQGIAMSSAGRFATPLGQINVNAELKQKISGLQQVTVMNEAFALEHSLEVHLPFLQTVLDDFTLLPLVVGDASARTVAAILNAVWGGIETLIVISSDLSHFHDYPTATKLDSETALYIRSLQADMIGPQQACGCMPMHGLLHIAREKNMEVNILDLRNSGDTTGDHDRVVGYGAFSFHEKSFLDQQHQEQLLDIACASIEHGFDHDKPLNPDPDNYSARLKEKRGLFVTLMLDGQLRGCIGNTEADIPLMASVAQNAYGAAFHDPRFQRLTRTEFTKISLDISVLTPKTEILFDSGQSLMDQLQPGIDGLVIMKDNRTATLLPSVWEKIPDPQEFLAQLKIKAGIGPDQLPHSAWKYKSTSFSKCMV